MARKLASTLSDMSSTITDEQSAWAARRDHANNAHAQLAISLRVCVKRTGIAYISYATMLITHSVIGLYSPLAAGLACRAGQAGSWGELGT